MSSLMQISETGAKWKGSKSTKKQTYNHLFILYMVVKNRVDLSGDITVKEEATFK